MSLQSPIDHAIEYTRKSWTKGEKLKEISGKFHVDPGNLARAFRNRYGITIKKFVDNKRRRVVHDLLKRRGIPGYLIAQELGMSEQTFYRWVKRVMGRSLRDLRDGK